MMDLQACPESKHVEEGEFLRHCIKVPGETGVRSAVLKMGRVFCS